jgi:hypothetical protein
MAPPYEDKDMSKIVWRVAPPPVLAQAVRQFALAEGRSSNMISRLIGEAVQARRVAEGRKPEIEKLIEVIRGQRGPA